LATRRSQSGKVQVSLVLVLLLALTGAYFLYALYPAILDEIDVRTALHTIANDGWHKKGREELHQRVVDKLATIGSHIEKTEDGPLARVPGLGVPDDDIVVTCTDHAQDCTDSDGAVRIDVRYQREIPLPWIEGKTLTLNFSPHAEATLNAVNW
jgi:hypothetical protein